MSPNPLSTILHRTWWVLLLRGLVAIAFGVLTWAQPAVSLAALVLTFGAFTFVDGLLGVYSAIQGRDQMRHWWVLLLWGLAGVVVGVLTVVAPGVTALVMTLYIGAWALVTGVLQAQPGAGMMAMLWVLATYAVIFGVLMVLLSFKLKKGIRHSS
jgi:uncharacterized membrane protein HdeD (DUF308 family)